MPEYEAPEDVWPKPGSKYSGSTHGFYVEARVAYHEPRSIGGLILDTRWKRIEFEKSPIGVPTSRRYDTALQATGLMTYQAANALRWWFLAQGDWADMLCVQTRLVRCTIQLSYDYQGEEAIEVRGTDEPRPTRKEPTP